MTPRRGVPLHDLAAEGQRLLAADAARRRAGEPPETIVRMSADDATKTHGLATHLMSPDLLDACGTAPRPGSLSLTPRREHVTCPACLALPLPPDGPVASPDRQPTAPARPSDADIEEKLVELRERQRLTHAGTHRSLQASIDALEWVLGRGEAG